MIRFQPCVRMPHITTPFARALLPLLAILVWLPGAALADPVRIVALGDSLTAGYQLPNASAFPAKLEAALHERGHEVEIINAGVSGDTASAGLARLDWSVPEGTDAVIVELGANDMLRGLDPSVTRDALGEIVEKLDARGIEILLAGMYASPNLGEEYGKEYAAVFSDLAAEHDLIFYPFFLGGVAGNRDLNLGDGIHPNEEGVDLIVEQILPSVEELIERVEQDG